VLVVEKRAAGGGNALFAGGFLWDVRGRDAVRHVESLFFGKTDRAVAQTYVTRLNDLLACGGFEADDYFKDAFLPLPQCTGWGMTATPATRSG
jgi:hypothetical protein